MIVVSNLPLVQTIMEPGFIISGRNELSWVNYPVKVFNDLEKKFKKNEANEKMCEKSRLNDRL